MKKNNAKREFDDQPFYYQAEKNLYYSHKFLEIANRYSEITPLLKEFISEIQTLSHCEAIGIRILDEEGNIPYQAYTGFCDDFYQEENHLSINCDQCMCINVVKGTIDPSLPYYTTYGSFYTNCTSQIISEVNNPTRNACNRYGFESVALIPITTNNVNLGLIHLADPKKNMISSETVELLEWVAKQLALAIKRVTSETVLKENALLLKQVDDNLPDGMVYRLIHTPDGRRICTHISNTCENLFQVTADDIKKDSAILYNMFSPDDIVRVSQAEKRSLETLEPFDFEGEFTLPNGEKRWFHWHSQPKCLDDGSYIWDGICQDITDRKITEDKLRNSEKTYRILTENIKDVVWVIDVESLRFKYISPSVKGLRGYTAEEVLSKPVIHSVIPEERERLIGLINSRAEKLSTVGSALHYSDEFQQPCKDGSSVWTEAIASIFINPENNRVEITGVSREITERKKAEEILRKSHKKLEIKVAERTKNLSDTNRLLIEEIDHRKQTEEKLKSAYQEIKNLKNKLQEECTYLGEEIKLIHNYDNIIGESDEIKYVLYSMEKIANTLTTVLIQGESGTGKELIARAIHFHSNRKDRAFIKVDCACLPEHLMESELFGHEKGAFTGAHEKRIGRFELADNATIFLDEIGELPLLMQQKLLRVLQDGEFERVGSSEVRHTNVRVIAATNRNLEEDVHKGRFRSDLLYRLNVFPLSIPPLRERTGDIPLLVDWIVNKMQRRLGTSINVIPKAFIESMKSYSWPGNIRELENVIERSMIVSQGNVLTLATPLNNSQNSSKPIPEDNTEVKSLAAMEKEYILRILNKTSWNVTGKNGAAELLGLPPSTLRGKMKKLNIQRPVS